MNSATVSLARIMNSSIMRCAIVRSYSQTSIPPSAESVIFASFTSRSTLPRASRFRIRISASSLQSSSMVTRCAYRSRKTASPSKIFATSVYVMRPCERMTDCAISGSVTLPFLSTFMMQERVSLSSPSRREHSPLESSTGSIGRTRSGKYTLVPRAYASLSSAPPRRT